METATISDRDPEPAQLHPPPLLHIVCPNPISERSFHMIALQSSAMTSSRDTQHTAKQCLKQTQTECGNKPHRVRRATIVRQIHNPSVPARHEDLDLVYSSRVHSELLPPPVNCTLRVYFILCMPFLVAELRTCRMHELSYQGVAQFLVLRPRYAGRANRPRKG